jgi:hypothetical protein
MKRIGLWTAILLALAGGFWVEGILEFLEYLIHLPLVLK